MLYPVFIYGTLHPDRAPAAIAATTRLLRPLGRATIRGRMYDLGEFPGVILAEDSPEDGDICESVSGELFAIPETAEGVSAQAILERLDAYEDYRSDDPAHSLFLRQLIEATICEGEGAEKRLCWVYTYNR